MIFQKGIYLNVKILFYITKYSLEHSETLDTKKTKQKIKLNLAVNAKTMQEYILCCWTNNLCRHTSKNSIGLNGIVSS